MLELLHQCSVIVGSFQFYSHMNTLYSLPHISTDVLECICYCVDLLFLCYVCLNSDRDSAMIESQ